MLEKRIERGILPSELGERQVRREFLALLECEATIHAAGAVRNKSKALLAAGYAPRYKLELFGVTYYLGNLRTDANFRFFVAYVRLAAKRDTLYPRIFYKDSSLVWRSPSHYIRSAEENWIGKGELKPVMENGEEVYYTAEETTNLPYEIQHALDVASRRMRRIVRDDEAVARILRKAPDNRVEPYEDFSAPRRRARADATNLVNRGESIAYFEREQDPTSLVFVAGYAPDFTRGFIEMTRSRSRMYGGEIRKYRFLSKNREIQYQFIAAPRHVWIIPPQALTTEIMSYGVRTIDVEADENLCIPGYEYHYIDEWENPPALYSQIPRGFVGKPSRVDPSRADASPWLERLPVIREFRAKVKLPWKAPRLPRR